MKKWIAGRAAATRVLAARATAAPAQDKGSFNMLCSVGPGCQPEDRPLVPPAAQTKSVDDDLKKSGSKDERARLVARWEREVLPAPK